MKFSPNLLVVCSLAALFGSRAASGQDVTTPAPSQPPQATTDQPQPEQIRRPYRGIFGAPADPATRRPSLDATFSVFGAYDDDLLAADSGTTTAVTGYPQRGWYPGATAGLVYTRPGDRVSGGLQGDVAVNHYPSLHDTTTMYRAGGTLSARIARHTTVAFAGDEVYAPQYRLGLFVNPAALTGEA